MLDVYLGLKKDGYDDKSIDSGKLFIPELGLSKVKIHDGPHIICKGGLSVDGRSTLVQIHFAVRSNA